jgi:hypothetical protein
MGRHWLIWLRIGTGGRLLWKRQWNWRFHKMQEISWLAVNLLASQRRLRPMEIVAYLVGFHERFESVTNSHILLVESTLQILCVCNFEVKLSKFNSKRPSAHNLHINKFPQLLLHVWRDCTLKSTIILDKRCKEKLVEPTVWCRSWDSILDLTMN